jgi:hypothetical protein
MDYNYSNSISIPEIKEKLEDKKSMFTYEDKEVINNINVY